MLFSVIGVRLALMPEGTGQIYRAHSLAYFRVEPDFLDAATTVLAALAGMGLTLPADRDLRWRGRIRADGTIPWSLEGDSCGGAFALGMWALLAGDRANPRTGALGPLRPEEFSGIAVTATVDRQVGLGPVGSEVLKL